MVHPATTASVIKAAVSTREFPDLIPVADEIKLTV
jgi:hypothetical protein